MDNVKKILASVKGIKSWRDAVDWSYCVGSEISSYVFSNARTAFISGIVVGILVGWTSC